MYFNKAFVIGNLTRDPEARALPSGGKVCQLSLATNRVWKDKTGAKQEASDYHNVVVFGPQAETVERYMRKGSMIMVEGRMQTRSWDGTDGQKKYRTEIVADRIQFGPRGVGGSGGAGASATGEADQGSGPSKPVETIEYPTEDINPDDIPF
jgi:single-strand DNA-binding protein